ncbi:MAG: hypothetical protein ACK4YQ_12710 [Phenylobacterium sp.]|uniref:hypothetical protein n=1 Tax=Phenylobacterium sp. TaxID=1871053 RepID=UPI003919CA07
MSLEPDHLEARRRESRPRPPWWRRISYARLAAIVFCLLVWIAVARACMRYF